MSLGKLEQIQIGVEASEWRLGSRYHFYHALNHGRCFPPLCLQQPPSWGIYFMRDKVNMTKRGGKIKIKCRAVSMKTLSGPFPQFSIMKCA